VFVQQPDDKVCIIKKFSLVDKRHVVRMGTELVGNVSFVWKVRVITASFCFRQRGLYRSSDLFIIYLVNGFLSLSIFGLWSR